jgi:hypothetical protein
LSHIVDFNKFIISRTDLTFIPALPNIASMKIIKLPLFFLTFFIFAASFFGKLTSAAQLKEVKTSLNLFLNLQNLIAAAYIGLASGCKV